MKCEHIEELLSPYLEDKLSREERRAVEEHVKSCKSCSLLLSSLEETTESLVSLPELEVSQDLLHQLYSIPEKKKKFSLGLDFFLRPSLQPVLGVIAIVLTLVSFYLFNPNRKAFEREISRQLHLGYSQVGKLYAKAESFTASLGEYKDTILVSLKNISGSRETENSTSDNNGGIQWKKKSSSPDHRNLPLSQESFPSSFHSEWVLFTTVNP
ncbi:MAG: zf-HC2 domain-containing protein [Candidatus Aminicenantes bacterium]|jgi:hypothetical protein